MSGTTNGSVASSGRENDGSKRGGEVDGANHGGAGATASVAAAAHETASNETASHESWRRQCEPLLAALREESGNEPRIFFDCTATIRDGLRTGIQRVVRNLMVSGPIAGKELGIDCRPVCCFDGVWYAAEQAPPDDRDHTPVDESQRKPQSVGAQIGRAHV